MRTLPVRLFAVLATLALLIGCADGGPSGPAATVDGAEIPRALLDDAVRELTDQLGELDADQRAEVVEPMQNQILTLLIQTKVIENLADELGLEIDQAELDEQLQSQIAMAGGEDELAQMLAGSGLTLTLLREALMPAQARVDVLRNDLLADAPAVEQREARHILLETEAEADEVVAELADGADFAQLAEERSVDPGSGQQGGDLGSAVRGAYVPPFDEAVWNATIGVIVGPVESDFGFHVIEVTGESTTAAEDLPQQQAEQLVGEDLARLLDDAFSAADIEVAPGLGVWSSELGMVVSEDQVGGGGG